MFSSARKVIIGFCVLPFFLLWSAAAAGAQVDASDDWGIFEFVTYACSSESMYSESGLWTSNPEGNPHPDDIGLGCESTTSVYTITGLDVDDLNSEVDTSQTTQSDPYPAGNYLITDNTTGLQVTAVLGSNGSITNIFSIQYTGSVNEAPTEEAPTEENASSDDVTTDPASGQDATVSGLPSTGAGKVADSDSMPILGGIVVISILGSVYISIQKRA